MFRTWIPAIAIVAAAMSPGHARGSTGKVTGTATYRERVALGPNAFFEAKLEDVSRADAPAEVIARFRKTNPGQVPIAFELEYPRERIDPRHAYVVRATLREGGRLRFITEPAAPVLTNGHGAKVAVEMRSAGAESEGVTAHPKPGPALGNLPATFTGLIPCADCEGIRYRLDLLPRGAYIQRMTYLRAGHDDNFYEIGAWSATDNGRTITLVSGRNARSFWAVTGARTLTKLDLQARPIVSKLPYELVRSSGAEPMTPRVEMRGMFRYLADAGRFRDCRSGLEWPVAMTADFVSLERAYAASRATPGADLLTSVRARIEEHPRMDGEGTEPTLVVERFLSSSPGRECEDHASTPASGVENNRWRPVRIGDRKVIVAAGRREPWIHLEPRTHRVTGSGGCNRISGTYTVGGTTLRFGPLVSTQMACSDLQTETAFLLALKATRRYHVSGRTLDLLGERGEVLVRLEERNLR